MNHKFRITNISPDHFIEIDGGQDITAESIKDYMSYGVWVLFGRKEDQLWTCLQVGQSNNIGSEIISDAKCLSGKIEIIEEKEYINQFGNSVEGYTYDIYLTPREQIYKKIGTQYNDFVFVCICCGESCKDDKKAIEKYVAWKLRALFWRNGRAFEKVKENVEEPKDIETIDFKEKESVNKMVEWYKNQKLKKMISDR